MSKEENMVWPVVEDPSQTVRALSPKFVKLTEDATLPMRGTPGSAGYDLVSREGMCIGPGERKLVSTGVGWTEIPECCVGFIKPRSGMALKHGMDVMAGVIDSDYAGEINVLLINHSDVDYVIQAGDRVAQLVVLQWFYLTPTKDEEVANDSREGGYGSTGR